MEFREWFEAEEKLKEGFAANAIMAFIQNGIRLLIPDVAMPIEDQVMQVVNQLVMHFHMNAGMARQYVQQYLKSNPNALNLPSMPA